MPAIIRMGKATGWRGGDDHSGRLVRFAMHPALVRRQAEEPRGELGSRDPYPSDAFQQGR